MTTDEFILDAIPAYDAPAGGQLTPGMVDAYEAAGVLVLRDFVPIEKCAELRKRALELVEAFDPGTVRSVFSTTSQTQLDDDYFIKSGDKIRFFLEDDAFDDDGGKCGARRDVLLFAQHECAQKFTQVSRQKRIGSKTDDKGGKETPGFDSLDGGQKILPAQCTQIMAEHIHQSCQQYIQIIRIGKSAEHLTKVYTANSQKNKNCAN